MLVQLVERIGDAGRDPDNVIAPPGQLRLGVQRDEKLKFRLRGTSRTGCRLNSSEKPGGISLEGGTATATRCLLALWMTKRGDRLMPSRAEFDVIDDLGPFLGNLILMDVIEGGRDYRFRVFGSTIASMLDEELQGKRLSEIPVEDARRLRSLFEQVVRSRAPTEFHHSGFGARQVAAYEALMLPLSANGESVDMILSLLSPPPRHGDAMRADIEPRAPRWRSKS